MKNEIISKALKQVWDWKDAIYKDVKDIPLKNALEKITADASKKAESMGFSVRESRARYGKK